jgi:hypothetical protein
MNAIENAKAYDFQTWLIGIMRSFISGGSSAIVSAFAVIGVAPDKFNFSDGLGKTAKVMLFMFAFTGIYRMCEFLQLHGAPDKVEQSLAQAAESAQVTVAAVKQAQSEASKP